MPIYPALVLLIGSSLASGSRHIRIATNILLAMLTLVFSALSTILFLVWRVPVQGGISNALTQHPEMYTLSLGHLMDLTLGTFAYLKLPLALAAFAFGASALALAYFRSNVRRAVLVIAAGMIIFFQAARIALIRFDPYLGSYSLAEQLQKSPPGQLIEANAYYAFSTVFFYANRTALLLNGRNNNLEYGSYAPDAPDVFIDDDRFAALWRGKPRWYLLAYGTELPHLQQVVGTDSLHVVAENAGNYLFTNHEIP